jgi:hypothetical protein
LRVTIKNFVARRAGETRSRPKASTSWAAWLYIRKPVYAFVFNAEARPAGNRRLMRDRFHYMSKLLPVLMKTAFLIAWEALGARFS